MPKTLFLRMGLNPGLKAALQTLADAENRKLTNFVETELLKIAAPKRERPCLDSPPRKRLARLTLYINATIKAELQQLAIDDYRNLADFVEVRLLESVAIHKAKGRLGAPQLPGAAPKANRILDQHARAARVAARINIPLKAALQKLANEQRCSLTDFVENQLEIIAARRGNRKRSMPQRRARSIGFSMRINAGFKATLEEMANEEYRTLTDFIELELHRIVAARNAKAKFGSSQGP